MVVVLNFLPFSPPSQGDRDHKVWPATGSAHTLAGQGLFPQGQRLLDSLWPANKRVNVYCKILDWKHCFQNNTVNKWVSGSIVTLRCREMSLTKRLCSCNSLLGNAAFLCPRINIHTKSVQSSLPRHFNTSATLSLQKDTKPGRVKRQVAAVNQKVGLVLMYKINTFSFLGGHNAEDGGEADDSWQGPPKLWAGLQVWFRMSFGFS